MTAPEGPQHSEFEDTRHHGVVPIRPLPRIRSYSSPAIVHVYDQIRAALDNDDEFAEFCWFAREYPRCYRFHMNAADFRLQSIHALMFDIRDELAARLPDSGPRLVETGASDMRVDRIYWDFESFLSEISICLDLAARVVGPAFTSDSPVSFNRLCKLAIPHPLIELFSKAQRRWVQRLKNYRDCFTHYTPVDTLLMVVLRHRRSEWHLRAKLPINPNVRDIVGFRYSWRVELLHYAISVHRHMAAFDRTIARTIWRLFTNKEFPVRTRNLFFVGRRMHTGSD